MREIKFRAWDEKLNAFHYWDSMTQEYNNVFWDLVKDHGMLPEQFTGLHDKNGKEIYEGDVVRDYMGEGYVKCGIIKGVPGFYVHTNQLISTEYHEVIGNIHEEQFKHLIK